MNGPLTWFLWRSLDTGEYMLTAHRAAWGRWALIATTTVD